MNDKSVFSKIYDGEIPSEIIYQNDNFFVIKDINPKAPTHLLIITKQPVKDIHALNPNSEAAASLVQTIQEVGNLLEKPEYRIKINCGATEGQEVFHLHVHLFSKSKLKSIA